MKKTTILPMASLLLLALWMAGCSPAPQPKEFKSEAGGFSVMTPMELKETKYPDAQGKEGKENQRFFIFTGTRGNVGCYVSYTILSKSTPNPKIIDYSLDKARDGMVKSAKGKLISETKITWEGNPGREILIDFNLDGQEMTLKMRAFLTKNHLYQIAWISPKNKPNPVEMTAFLDSFRLLKKEQK